MRLKAGNSYNSAVSLLNAKQYDSAASRAYYSLYQMIVSCWEEAGHIPSDVDQFGKMSDSNERWRHKFILDNLSKMRLSADQEDTIQTAYALRVKADYRPDGIRDEIEDIIGAIPDIFNQLKKTPIKG